MGVPVPPRAPVPSPLYQPHHLAHGLLEADHRSACHHGETDGHLFHVRAGGLEEAFDIAVVEAVPGVHAQAGGFGGRGGFGQAGERVLLGGGRLGFREVAGVQLDGVGARLGGGFDLGRHGIDEEGDLACAGVVEPVGGARQALGGGAHVQSALGGHFFAAFGDEGRQIGAHVAADGENLCVGRAFQIKLAAHRLRKQAHVALGDVAAVFAQVHHHPVGTSGLGAEGRLDGVGPLGAARVAQRGHVVDVDKQVGWHSGRSERPSDSQKLGEAKRDLGADSCNLFEKKLYSLSWSSSPPPVRRSSAPRRIDARPFVLAPSPFRTVSSDQKRVILQVVLGIVIVVLAYVLYVSITAPYEQIRAEQRMTERVRARMRLVGDALISYRDQQGRFPNTLDSLRTFVAQNQQLRNNLSSEAEIQDFAPDSLLQSPRTGEPFQYETSPDSARVDIYRLRDPDSQDQIGTLDLDVTRVNAANWE